MKTVKKTVSVFLAVLTVLSCMSAASFAAENGKQIVQYNLIIEADGRSTHWEDTDGNIVKDFSADGSAYAKRAKSPYYLPSAYDSRELQLVTPVKNQGNYGTCWAFAASSCVETALIKKGLADNTIDLSEDHLVWFGKNSLVTDASDGTVGDGEAYSDTDSAFQAGGTWMDSVSAYARGSGPVYDADYPYATGSWDESHRYNAEFRVTDCSAIDYTAENMAKIKRAIMEFGSVKTSYYNHNWYYNLTENGSAYYNPDTENKGTNHDVTIVGWDDNYSVENFKADYRPNGNGAWLVKGSWGDNYHLKDGYFWMSYEESEITTVSYYDADVKSIYDNTYQYDGIGSYSSLRYMGRSTMYGANVFTARGHELLNRVGFYSKGAVLYTVYIYKLNSATDKPTDGELVSTVSGAEKYYGYHSVQLTSPVEVNTGDVFSAVLKIEVSSDDASIMTEGTMYDTSFREYESYLSSDGKNWDTVAPDKGYFKTAGNVCLKVMSTDVKGCLHSYSETVTEPTCTEAGFTTFTCSECGDTYTGNTVPATGHTEETVPGTAPTCTKTGLTDGIRCSVCKTVIKEQKQLDVAEHTPEPVAAVPPTCTESGLSAGSRCSVCGTVLLEQEILEPIGHNFGDFYTVLPPSCTVTGLLERSCSECGEKETKKLDRLPHTEETVPGTAPTCTKTGLTDGIRCAVCKTVIKEQKQLDAAEHTPEPVAAVPPTCTESGLSAGSRCSVCGTVLLEQEILEPLGHNFGDFYTVLPPSCTVTGLLERSCSECGEKETKILDRLPHTEETVPGTAPTCTKTGLTDGIRCSVCKTVIKEQTTIEVTAHTYVDTVVPPTCTAGGYTAHTCSVCNGFFKDSETAPLGHKTGEWTQTKAPTCTEEGQQIKKCLRCDYTETGTLQKLPHTDADNDGVCDDCNKELNNGGTENCSCLCHKKGFASFFWKIKLFFIKLFGIQKTCTCGKNHY